MENELLKLLWFVVVVDRVETLRIPLRNDLRGRPDQFHHLVSCRALHLCQLWWGRVVVERLRLVRLIWMFTQTTLSPQLNLNAFELCLIHGESSNQGSEAIPLSSLVHTHAAH